MTEQAIEEAKRRFANRKRAEPTTIIVKSLDELADEGKEGERANEAAEARRQERSGEQPTKELGSK